MANLTITVPEGTLRRARSRAAREGTSVNEVLRRELAAYVEQDDETAAAWDRFLELARSSPGSSGPHGRAWTRDEIQRDTAR
ncbi:MAG: hypothetical protein ACRD1K_10485 [Acidimicrobiales bacterium]